MIFSGVVRVRRCSRLFRTSCKLVESPQGLFVVVRHCSWRVGVPVGVQHATSEGLLLRGLRKNEPAICSYFRTPRCGNTTPFLPLLHNLRFVYCSYYGLYYDREGL